MILDLVKNGLRTRCRPSVLSQDTDLIFEAIRHLQVDYPGLRAWYYDTVIPEISAGKRQLFTRYDHGRVAGVAIAKRGEEDKLCTLWVAHFARSKGLATNLAKEAFDWIGHDRPLFTVPEGRISDFRPLTARWGFIPTDFLPGYYVDNSIECIFNGKLRSTCRY